MAPEVLEGEAPPAPPLPRPMTVGYSLDVQLVLPPGELRLNMTSYFNWPSGPMAY